MSGDTKAKVFESDEAISKTGTLKVSDPDPSDAVKYQVKEGAATLLGSSNTFGGTLTLDNKGNWTYQLDVTNNAEKLATLQALQDPQYKNDLTNGTTISDFQIIERFEVQIEAVDGSLDPDNPTVSNATYDGTVPIKR